MQINYKKVFKIICRIKNSTMKIILINYKNINNYKIWDNDDVTYKNEVSL